MSICLGTRIVSVKDNKNSSSSTATKRAVILIEVNNTCDHSLAIQLSTETSAYRCSISLSDVSSICVDDSIDGGAQILEIGRLFLREHSPDGEENGSFQKRSKNLTTTFHYESEVDDRFNKNYNIVLMLQEKVVNEMKRTIYRTQMEKIDVVSHCISVGDALNKSLQEVEYLKNEVNLWKKAAKDMSDAEQKSKSTLLHNFTKLRNWMNEKHQIELCRLEQNHKNDKEAWAASMRKKPTLARKSTDSSDPIDDAKEVFGGKNVLALAEGRKLYRKHKNRVSVLRSNDAVDMVGILQEGRTYEMNRNGYRDEKQKRRQESEQSGLNIDSSDDNVGSSNETNNRKKLKGSL